MSKKLPEAITAEDQYLLAINARLDVVIGIMQDMLAMTKPNEEVTVTTEDTVETPKPRARKSVKKEG